MTQCLYDNPHNYHREWWIDGKIKAWWTAELIMDYISRGIDEPLMPDYSWESNNVVGDPRATFEDG